MSQPRAQRGQISVGPKTIPQEDIFEDFQLYNGEVILRYYPRSHKYYVLKGGRKFTVPSVTTALDVVNKPALIPWAINQTIEFIRPAISPGVEHAESYLEEVYARAKKESRRIKSAAGDIGTEAHNILQLPDSARPELGSIADESVRNCVAAGLEWQAAHKVEWIFQERPVYSRRYRYSGRLDGVARVDGITSLVDYKSSNGVYPEYRLQCAAYTRAVTEELPELGIDQIVLLHLGKADGSFTPHIYTRDSLRADFQAFLAALRLHNRLKAIKQEEKLSRKHQSEDQTI